MRAATFCLECVADPCGSQGEHEGFKHPPVSNSILTGLKSARLDVQPGSLSKVYRQDAKPVRAVGPPVVSSKLPPNSSSPRRLKQTATIFSTI